MAITEIKWNPTPQELRGFGEAGIGIATAAALLLHFWMGWPAQTVLYICAAGLGVFLLSRLSLVATRWLYVGMMIVFFPVAFVMGYVLFGAVYFLVITPLGLAMRLTGRDPLARKLDPDASSYWEPKIVPEDMSRYYKQF